MIRGFFVATGVALLLCAPGCGDDRSRSSANAGSATIPMSTGGAAGRAGAGGIGGTGPSGGGPHGAPGGSAGHQSPAAGKGGSVTGDAGVNTAAGGNAGGDFAGSGGAQNAGQAGLGGSGALAGGGAGMAGAGPRPTIMAEPGTTLVKVDSTLRYQSFEGWGTSLCWWANHVGGWSTAARNAVVAAVVDPVDGLGYNVFRYNIGGGENPSHEHMGEHREMPGFSPSAGTWDWNADANQRAILQRIVETGEGIILEAFSNSPPHWMTKSGCASGSADGSNNLKDDAYDDFADYLTEVVKHFRDELNIEFRTLEPLNEPNANWWKSNGSQEGCHFSPSNQEQIIRAVAAALELKGLTATSVSASDENSMDEAYENMRAFDATTFAAISQVNTHSYAGSRRAEVRALATNRGKRLWQSESGPLNQTLADDTDAALFMAGRIITDLRELKPEAWLDWQVGDPARSWASLVLNDSQQTFSRIKRFYMHAGFSRYIRPGATFVEVNHPDMVAALSADGGTLTLVARNGSTSESKGFTFDLTALPGVGSAAEAHRTSRTEDLVPLPDASIEGYRFVATLPAASVTTFVLSMPAP
jgi:O-glycosyl hydrolase